MILPRAEDMLRVGQFNHQPIRGHFVVWDLEKRRMHHVREAHRGPITHMAFVPKEPLLQPGFAWSAFQDTGGMRFSEKWVGGLVGQDWRMGENRAEVAEAEST